MNARLTCILTPLLGALLTASLCSCSSSQEIPTDPGDPAGDPACVEVAKPEVPTWSRVTVRVRNNSAAPRYLGSGDGCIEVPFRIRDSSGKDLVWKLGSCALNCDQLSDGFCGCTTDCPPVSVYMIPPGSALEATWSGSIFEEKSVPESCFAALGCGRTTCLREQAAPQGPLELTASLWPSAKGCDPSGCTCDPGANHFCKLDHVATLDGEPETASAMRTDPSAKLVEIVIP
jgi:hypothetical protein